MKTHTAIHIIHVTDILCVQICICMYIYMHIYNAYVYKCTLSHTRTNKHAHTIHTYTYPHAHTHKYTFTCRQMHRLVHIKKCRFCTYTRIIHTRCIHTRANIQISVCLCVSGQSDRWVIWLVDFFLQSVSKEFRQRTPSWIKLVKLICLWLDLPCVAPSPCVAL